MLEPNDLPWLNFKKEVPADLLSDLNTRENSLSIYEIEDDESNVDRIIAAIASTRNQFAIIDYAVFGSDIINKLNIQINSAIGATPDTEVNNLHKDLINLTASKLSDLAKEILKKGQFNRRGLKGVKTLIKDGLNNGNIEKTKINKGLMKKLKIGTTF